MLRQAAGYLQDVRRATDAKVMNHDLQAVPALLRMLSAARRLIQCWAYAEETSGR